MNQDIELAFIGCGNMGSAILDGILGAKSLPADRILVVERSPERLAECAARGVRTTDRLEEARRVPKLLLAVKPQGFAEVAEGLGRLPSPALIISVMAGLSSAKLQSAFGAEARVVRTMPNTPCRIGAGITAVAPGEGATETDLRETEAILSTVGEVVRVEESEMHAVTATSGSGPAYAFLLAEAWIEASVRRGITRDTAERLVLATLHGASRLLLEHRDPVDLRAAVTSRGGTTAAAIAELERLGLREAMVSAIDAATRRGVELDSEVPT